MARRSPPVPATATARTIAALRDLYEAYGRKDPSVFFGMLSRDVRFRIAAPRPHFRFAGPARGKAAVQRAIAQIAEDYEWQQFANRTVIGDGDRFFAVSGGRIKHRASGAVMTLELIDVIRVRNGKIVEFTEYFDSARVLALQGHDLSPPAAAARTGRKAGRRRSAGTTRKPRQPAARAALERPRRKPR